MSETSIPEFRPAGAERRPPRRRSFADFPLAQLIYVRIMESAREPEALFWAFVFPLLLAAGLAVAFRNRPPEVLQVAAVTPEIARALEKEKGLAVLSLEPQAAAEALRAGKVALLAEPGSGGSVIYRYDDTNPEGRAARFLVDDAIQKAAGRTDLVSTNDKLVREPGSRYIDFLLPGLLGMNLMGSAMWSIGFAIVDARRKKLLKRLVASPMSRRDYLLSFLLSRILLLVVEVGALVGFGAVMFHVPVRGSLFDLALLCVLSSLCFCALGLLVASRARTLEAASGLMNTVMMPMWIASGVFFSSQRFPAIMQPFVKALPLTAVIDALRASMLQGAHFSQIAAQIGIISAWMVVCFGLALKLFRWR